MTATALPILNNDPQDLDVLALETSAGENEDIPWNHPALLTESWNAIHLEFTSRCNLRCVYCAVSADGYEGKDLSDETIESVLDFIKRHRVSKILVNGHGETSLVDGWYEYCDRLLETGAKLTIISNFAKPFSEREIETLAQFRFIQVSIDTMDRDLLKETRRKVDVRTVIHNLNRVKARAIQRYMQGLQNHRPDYSFSAVVHDKNIMTLPELMWQGIALGVEHYTFCNLQKYPDIEGATNVYPVSSMEPEQCKEALAIFDWIEELGQQVGARIEIMAGLRESLEDKINKGSADSHQLGATIRFSQTPQEGQTRDCIDPWKLMMFDSRQSAILPCCWADKIGDLNKGKTIDEIVNSRAAQQLRHQVLTGKLAKYCASCPARALISVDAFRKKYAAQIGAQEYP